MKPVFRKYLSVIGLLMLALVAGAQKGECLRHLPGPYPTHAPKTALMHVERQAMGITAPCNRQDPSHPQTSMHWAVEETDHEDDDRENFSAALYYYGNTPYSSYLAAAVTTKSGEKLSSGGPSLFYAGPWYLHICVFLI